MNKKLLAGIAGGAIAVIAAVSIAFGGGANAATGKYTYETATVGKGDVLIVIKPE